MNRTQTDAEGVWVNTHSASTKRATFSQKIWQLLWQIQLPRNNWVRSTLPTFSGLVLVALSIGIGGIAYINASNILFLTLSLLLSCILMSGIMAWANFRALSWRLRLPPNFRAGEVACVMIDIHNKKKLLPTFGLRLRIGLEQHSEYDDVALRDTLPPKATQAIEWLPRPNARGKTKIEFDRIESYYPFGFLKKNVPARLEQTALVWPARVSYTFTLPRDKGTHPSGRERMKQGSGSELISIRDYRHGDNPRHIHWKASARQKKLMVRRLGEESRDHIRLLIEPENWQTGDAYERMLAFAASLAEDLYRDGRLKATCITGQPDHRITQHQDLYQFFDTLAKLEPGTTQSERPRPNDHLLNIRFSSSEDDTINAHVQNTICGTCAAPLPSDAS